MSPLAQQFDSFTERLAQLQPRLRAFVLALVGNGSDADEVLLDANQVLLRKRHSFQTGSSFDAWAFQIAAYEARNFSRRRARDCTTMDAGDYLVVAKNPSEPSAATPERAAKTDATSRALLERLARATTFYEGLKTTMMQERAHRRAEKAD